MSDDSLVLHIFKEISEPYMDTRIVKINYDEDDWDKRYIEEEVKVVKQFAYCNRLKIRGGIRVENAPILNRMRPIDELKELFEGGHIRGSLGICKYCYLAYVRETEDNFMESEE